MDSEEATASREDPPQAEAISDNPPTAVDAPAPPANDQASAEAKAKKKAERMAALMAKQKQAASTVASAAAPAAITAAPVEDPLTALKAYLGVYSHEEKVMDPYCELPVVLPEMPEEVNARLRALYHRCMAPAGKDEEIVALCGDLVRLVTGEPAPTRTAGASTTTAAEAPVETRRRKKKVEGDAAPARSSSAGTSVRERLEARRSGSRAPSAAASRTEKPEEKPLARASLSAGGRRRRVGSSGGLSLLAAPAEQRAGLLLNCGVGFKGATLLHACAYGNKPKAAAALVKMGADPNAGDRQQRSALMVAAALGHNATAKALLASRADPQQTDVSGWAPVLYATRGGHARLATDIVRQLGNVPVQENK